MYVHCEVCCRPILPICRKAQWECVIGKGSTYHRSKVLLLNNITYCIHTSKFPCPHIHTYTHAHPHTISKQSLQGNPDKVYVEQDKNTVMLDLYTRLKNEKFYFQPQQDDNTIIAVKGDSPSYLFRFPV